MSPASAGGFLSIISPGKSTMSFNMYFSLDVIMIFLFFFGLKQLEQDIFVCVDVCLCMCVCVCSETAIETSSGNSPAN